MKKKKEQVKYLKKCFRSVLKAFEKEKDKKKRQEAFDFLTGRMTEVKECIREDHSAGPDKAQEADSSEVQVTNSVKPSAALVEELRAEHHTNPQ